MYDFHKTRQENHENAFKNIMFKRGFKYPSHHSGTCSRTYNARIIRKIKKIRRNLFQVKKAPSRSLKKTPEIKK
jgi:adenine-specific DNA methylase